jgi:hypothetical protein
VHREMSPFGTKLPKLVGQSIMDLDAEVAR